MVEQTRPLPLTLTNAYESLALVPTTDTNALTGDPAAEDGACASHGESSSSSAESPEQSFGLKDDGLAEMFEIHCVVRVSRILQDALKMQTNPWSRI